MEMHGRYELIIAVYACKHSVQVWGSIVCVVAANIMVRYSCKRTIQGRVMSLRHCSEHSLQKVEARTERKYFEILKK